MYIFKPFSYIKEYIQKTVFRDKETDITNKTDKIEQYVPLDILREEILPKVLDLKRKDKFNELSKIIKNINANGKWDIYNAITGSTLCLNDGGTDFFFRIQTNVEKLDFGTDTSSSTIYFIIHSTSNADKSQGEVIIHVHNLENINKDIQIFLHFIKMFAEENDPPSFFQPLKTVLDQQKIPYDYLQNCLKKQISLDINKSRLLKEEIDIQLISNIFHTVKNAYFNDDRRRLGLGISKTLEAANVPNNSNRMYKTKNALNKEKIKANASKKIRVCTLETFVN